MKEANIKATISEVLEEQFSSSIQAARVDEFPFEVARNYSRYLENVERRISGALKEVQKAATAAMTQAKNDRRHIDAKIEGMVKRKTSEKEISMFLRRQISLSEDSIARAISPAFTAFNADDTLQSVAFKTKQPVR